MDTQALGRYLRQSREAKELTLEDAEQSLRIRRRILEDFELGDFNAAELSPIQIIGFIRNYARFLGLDEDLVLQYYEAAQNDTLRRVQRANKRGRGKKRGRNGKRDSQSMTGVPTAARSITDTQPKLPIPPQNSTTFNTMEPPRRGVGVFGWIIRALVAGASIAVIAFVATQLIDTTPITLPPDAPDQPDILAQLPPTSTITPGFTRTPILSSPVPEGLQQLYSGQGLLLTVQFQQRSWVRLLTDSAERFVGIAAPGTVLEYPAQESITLTASNAEALDVVFNGEAQPSFGDRGQRVDVTFSREGVQIVTGPGFAPTAIFSDTPLPTPTDAAGQIVAALTPTATITLTPTPGPSPTPSDTPTITNTPTETLTPTITPSPTVTLTPSNTPTITLTPTITPTPTVTLTPSNTPTRTLTLAPTLVPSATRTPTDTPTLRPSAVPSQTAILPPRITPTGQPPGKN